MILCIAHAALALFELQFPFEVEDHPDAAYVLRASGIALAKGSVTMRPLGRGGAVQNLPAGMVVVHASRPQGRVAVAVGSVGLDVPGEYFIEVIKLFDSFSLAKPTSQLARVCVRAGVEQPVFIARYRLASGRAVDRHSAPQWIADAAPGYAPLWTRVQQCRPHGACEPDFLQAHPDPSTPLLTNNRAHLRSYEWATYSHADGRATPLRAHRRRVDGLCIFGGSHARNLCAEIPGCTWVAHRFAHSPVCVCAVCSSVSIQCSSDRCHPP